MDTLSGLLERVAQGDVQAREALFATAYGELRKLAHARLRDGGRGPLLDTTALVHESFLRFTGNGRLRAEDRRGFFAYASQVMRSVIVDTVREQRALRRGGDLLLVTLDTQRSGAAPADSEQVLRVDEALQALARVEPRLASVVEMRYFGGYSDPEIAEALALTARTVRRDWEKARLLLYAALQG